MNILILNFILSTAVDGKIIRRPTNKDTMIYSMARGFVANGHKVTLLASEEYRPTEPESEVFDIVYFKSALPRVFKPSLLPYPKGLRKYLKANAANADMVLSVDAFSIPTLIAAITCGDKLLIWQEMSYHQKMMHQLPAKVWYNLFVRTFMRNCTTIAMSANARTYISRYIKTVTPETIGHGANDQIFFPGTGSDSSFVIISMLVYRKRIDRMIKKFADFIQNTPHKDFTLNIIGEGPEKENLQKLAQTYGIAGNVKFRGFLKHIDFAPIGRKAKAMLIDTRQDLNMVTVPEAIVNGTPILMNTVPSSADFIQQHRLGIAKHEWDWHDLNEMVECYDEFHQNCIKHRNKFSNEGCAKKLSDIFCRQKHR